MHSTCRSCPVVAGVLRNKLLGLGYGYDPSHCRHTDDRSGNNPVQRLTADDHWASVVETEGNPVAHHRTVTADSGLEPADMAHWRTSQSMRVVEVG